MHCEYCDMSLYDTAEARKHMLSIGHVRNKRSYDLNKNKYRERKTQTLIHPKNLTELASLLNMHSSQDVISLDKNDNFFKMREQRHFAIAENLLTILQEAGLEYQLNALHPEVRSALVQSVKNEKASASSDKQQK